MKHIYTVAWSNQRVPNAYGCTDFATFPEAWASFKSLKSRGFFATLFMDKDTIADFRPEQAK